MQTSTYGNPYPDTRRKSLRGGCEWIFVESKGDFRFVHRHVTEDDARREHAALTANLYPTDYQARTEQVVMLNHVEAEVGLLDGLLVIMADAGTADATRYVVDRDGAVIRSDGMAMEIL